jgi:hypothetical protein
MLGAAGVGKEDDAVGQNQEAGDGDSVKWRHSEEIAGRAFADEVLLTARRDLIGQVFCKGFIERLKERLCNDCGK